MAQPRPLHRSEHYRDANDVPVLTPEESRQGVISGRVLGVLMAGLTLALIAFVIVYALEVV